MQRHLDSGRYAGSVTIVSDLLQDLASIDIFDQNPQAVESFRDLPVNRLDLGSGYDILDMAKAYDLIFLDPYGDFWEVRREVIGKIHGKVQDSSILLFASLEQEGDWVQLIDLVRKLGLAYVEGAVKGKGGELDGRYYQGVIFFPGLQISQGELDGLAQNLRKITAVVSKVIQSGV